MKALFQSQQFFWIILLGLFFFIEWVINPIGNFPLNDDWYYERALNTWNQTGNLLSAQRGYTSMVSHLLFGKLTTTCFGYSYTTLRFSGLFWFLLLILVFVFYRSRNFRLNLIKRLY